MPAIEMSVLCIPAECDNIKNPYNGEVASRWDAYCYTHICRHFASVMLHFASLISHNLRCIPAYTHQIPTGFIQSLLNNHRNNLYIISFFSWHCRKAVSELSQICCGIVARLKFLSKIRFLYNIMCGSWGGSHIAFLGRFWRVRKFWV